MLVTSASGKPIFNHKNWNNKNSNTLFIVLFKILKYALYNKLNM